MKELIESKASDRFYLYGTATGAQMAIAYALRHPQQVMHLYLDNAAHFADAECETILQEYFPGFAPKQDGSHLISLWQPVCNSCLNFPWYATNELHHIADTLQPIVVLQQMVNDYLAAGTAYDAAYRAAFKHERAMHVQQLLVSTTNFKWLGSPLLKYIEALCSFELPSNLSVKTTPALLSERYSAMKQEMISLVS